MGRRSAPPSTTHAASIRSRSPGASSRRPATRHAEPPHVGRGGWTWYTGSAGWMYRAGLESILGFRLRGARLVIDPCIPRAWHGFDMVFRYRSARYDLVVENPRGVSRGVSSVEVD